MILGPFSDLGENVCTVTEEVVSLQQNCVDCLKNVSSVLLTNEGSRMYVGAKSLLLSVDMDKCETTNTVSNAINYIHSTKFYATKIIEYSGNLNSLICSVIDLFCS